MLQEDEGVRPPQEEDGVHENEVGEAPLESLAEEESSDQERLIPVVTTRHYSECDSKRVRRSVMEYFFSLVPEAVVLRVKLIGLIWRLMVAIFMNYVVTLLVFPGLVSEVQYCRVGDWMPVILITVFNFTDFIAKVCCTPICVLIN